MRGIDIFLPVLAHIFLVLALFVVLLVRKTKAAKQGAVDLKVTSLDNKAWTKEVVQVSNNIANQFETPVLFYVLCTVLFLSNGVNSVTLTLAWAYVLLRLFHAYVHVGSNYVPVRMKTFALSLLVLLVLLAYSIGKVISAAASIV